MHAKQDQDNSGATANANINTGYAFGQLASALHTQEVHPDQETRANAANRVNDWVKVISGILSGSLKIGSRTPVKDIPAWATLRVVRGGFATSDLLAGGPLQEHETQILGQFGVTARKTPRLTLNRYYLSVEGVTDLYKILETGCYRINVPEEAALLTVAWLIAHDDANAARALLDEIRPFFGRLRFYPVPASQPLAATAFVHLRSVGQVTDSLQAIQTPLELQRQTEAILVWKPMCDRAVALFLETVIGGIPSVRSEEDGRPILSEQGKRIIDGGWPCQLYSDAWKARARALVDEFVQLRKAHPLCVSPSKSGANLADLIRCLEICVLDPQLLTGRDVGRVRSILAHIVTCRGVPDSDRCRRLRQQQTAIAKLPTRADLAHVVVNRLSAFDSDQGLDTLDNALAPLAASEALKFQLPVGAAIAPWFTTAVRSCLAGPLELLLHEKIIGSSEVLATVVPQVTAQIATASVTDPDARRLFAATYQAFRRRRSLLLLNLQSQVKLSELPWVTAVASARQDDSRTQEQARSALIEMASAAISAFPQQIFPNKLIREFRTLAASAGVKIPFVDELAADIFMGAFAENFLRAAQAAGRVLRGTLYERYYGLSFSSIQRLDDASPIGSSRTPISPAFYQICSELAGPRTAGSWVAANGRIIEQEQILTTHNLAALFEIPELREKMMPRLETLARTCFAWICQRQQQRIPDWNAKLHSVKNAAYAWRQMIFFLSLLPDQPQREFVAWADTYLVSQSSEFQARFQPALDGLKAAMNAGHTRYGHVASAISSPLRFLGWATGAHWLINSGPTSTD